MPLDDLKVLIVGFEAPAGRVAGLIWAAVQWFWKMQ